MLAHDQLLYWLSDRGNVRTPRFRAACAFLEPARAGNTDRSVRRISRPLYRLGHIEFLPSDQRWVVTPPICLWRGGEDGHGELYGARSPGLRRMLEERFAAVLQIRSCPDGPERWLLRVPREQVESALASLQPRIEVSSERGLDLLRCLPSLRDAVRHEAVYVPNQQATHWEQCNFLAGRYPPHQWQALPSPPVNEEGLYRERIGKLNSWFHLLGGRKADLPTEEHRCVAWWHERIRAGGAKLRYRKVDGALLVPSGGLPLPLLLDRALCLAEGELPSLVDNRAWWCYPRIGPDRARELLRILECPYSEE